MPALYFEGRVDSPFQCPFSSCLDMAFHHFVLAEFLGELSYARDHETENDGTTDRVGEDQSPSKVGIGIKVAESNGQYSYIAEIQC